MQLRGARSGGCSGLGSIPGPRPSTLICAAPCATLTLGGRPGPRICGGNSASGFPPFVFCTFSPSPPPWTNF